MDTPPPALDASCHRTKLATIKQRSPSFFDPFEHSTTPSPALCGIVAEPLDPPDTQIAHPLSHVDLVKTLEGSAHMRSGLPVVTGPPPISICRASLDGPIRICRSAELAGTASCSERQGSYPISPIPPPHGTASHNERHLSSPVPGTASHNERQGSSPISPIPPPLGTANSGERHLSSPMSSAAGRGKHQGSSPTPGIARSGNWQRRLPVVPVSEVHHPASAFAIQKARREPHPLDDSDTEVDTDSCCASSRYSSATGGPVTLETKDFVLTGSQELDDALPGWASNDPKPASGERSSLQSSLLGPAAGKLARLKLSTSSPFMDPSSFLPGGLKMPYKKVADAPLCGTERCAVISRHSASDDRLSAAHVEHDGQVL